jgi:hypothetical protein
MRGNRTHLVFRHKMGTNDRDLPGELSKRVPVVGARRFRRPLQLHESRLPSDYPLNRSAGGAISVTRSRTSALFESGLTVISRGSRRSVQA